MAKLKNKSYIVDIGGASTEIIEVNNKPFKIIQSISLPFGSVRATDWMSEQNLSEQLEKIWSEKININVSCKDAIFVAGTMTSLGAIIKGQSVFDASALVDQTISFDRFEAFIHKIKNISSDDLLSQYPFLGKRAKSIIGGALVAVFIGRKLQLENILVSPFGLRYGTCLVERIEDKYVEQFIG